MRTLFETAVQSTGGRWCSIGNEAVRVSAEQASQAATWLGRRSGEGADWLWLKRYSKFGPYSDPGRAHRVSAHGPPPPYGTSSSVT